MMRSLDLQNGRRRAVFLLVLEGLLGMSVPRAFGEALTTQGSAASVTNAGQSGLTWRWRHDDQGRLTEIVGPGSVTTLVTYASAAGKGDGMSTDTVDCVGERRTFVRDAQGRLVRAAGAGGNVALSYNKVGLPAQVRCDGAPAVRYTYSVLDQLTEMRIGSGTSATAIGYRYDYLGRLTNVITSSGEIVYSYQPGVNRVIRKLPNGVQTVREYDDEGRLVKVAHVDAKSYIIAEYSYTYRPDGLLAGIIETNQRNGQRVFRYEYDLMQRLIAAECRGEGQSYRYAYDALGNLAQVQPDKGDALRFTSAATGALENDNRGACRTDERGHIRQLPGPTGPTDYDFDGAGRLVGAKGRTVAYTYNALGLLTARRTDTSDTRYLPDPFADAWQPLWIRDPKGAESVIVWDGACPVVEMRGKAVRYGLEDHLGSVRVELDAGGKVLAWHDYAPYGTPEAAEPDTAPRPAFAGLFWDPDARIYLAMARAYDPVIGRFLQPDPQLRMPDVSKQTHSLYAYCGGDPVNWVDRNGAEPEPSDAQRPWDGVGHYMTPPYPGEMPNMYIQRLDDGTHREWLISTLERYETETATRLHPTTPPTVLTRAQRQEIRRDAVNRFASDFSQDALGHNSSPIREYRDHIANMSIVTRNGPMSVDWLNTIVQKGVPSGPIEFVTSRMPPAVRYYVGKTVNNLVVKPLGGGPSTDWREFFPKRDQNALAVVQTEIFNSDIPFRRVFAPPQAASVRWDGAASWRGFSRSPTLQDYAEDAVSRAVNPYQGQNTILDKAWQAARKTTWPGQDPKRESDSRLRKPRRDEYAAFPPGGGGGGPGGPGGGGPGGGGGGWGRGGSDFPRMSPSRVGGVYLGGAGKALEGLGQLKGVAVDRTTGKLVLIGADEKQTALPPLRLDDVVTVFRAVFDHGESPTVTIDPDEKNPTGPVMHVKHGPGTAGTYVGWVLFECDRIMKTYQLGKDNISRQPIISHVPGHAKTVDTVFFGDNTHAGAAERVLKRLFGGDKSSEAVWERFWIVPATVRRFDSAAGDLSLFELPLKVNTQKMRWKKGNLVDDEKGKSSVGAEAFTRWFTDHYADIADEVRLTPPAESGMSAPVAVFHELRRIAVIAAVAERLRDQGESLPAWMREYPVAPFPVDETTLSLTMEKTNNVGNMVHTATIYGGVNLLPADKDVHSYGGGAKAGKLAPVPPEEVLFVEVSKREAVALAAKVPELARADNGAGKLQTVVTDDGKQLSAAVLPGADSRALAPNRQVAADMVVPIGLGRSIALTLYYNSFFDPTGECGKGWTLDLPVLLLPKVPVSWDGKLLKCRVAPHLVSPLGSVDIRFDQTARVEPFKAEMAVAKDHPEIAGVAAVENEIIGGTTHQVLFRDGTEWHFDDDGRLVLEQADGTATRYIRDSAGRVRQIVGYVGKSVAGDIRLTYDQDGRITKAEAKQADDLRKQAPADVNELCFEYGKDGRLATVTRPGAEDGEARRVVCSYSYEGSRLGKISDADGVERSFAYNSRGQMIREQQGDWKREYAVVATPDGAVLTDGSGGAGAATWTYDARMRPVKADLGDEQKVTWKYGQGKEVQETLSHGDAIALTHKTSLDGQTETTTLANGPAYELKRDTCARPVSLTRDGIGAAQIAWAGDGSLAGMTMGVSTVLTPVRHKDGWQNGLTVSAPAKDGKTDQWLEEEWDILGRPRRITDSSGLEYALAYDDEGRLKSFGRPTKDGKLSGTILAYDSAGRLTALDSSWGKETRSYSKDGVLKNVENERQGSKATTTCDDQGRVVSHVAFDGGTTSCHYDSADAGVPPRTVDLPNGQRLEYEWQERAAESGGRVRLGPAEVALYSDSHGPTVMTWAGRIP